MSELEETPKSHRYAVIVAGGVGTRLWPLSREALPKQMQAVISDSSLIAETVARLSGVVDESNIYISTTKNYSDQIAELVPSIPRENIVIEPEARGTAPAFALVSHTLWLRDPDAVVFSLASDHTITEVDRFRQTMLDAYEFAETHPTHIVIVGIEPTRPDTGLGYIKIRDMLQDEPRVYEAQKFVEKPSQEVARSYVESGEYYWNAAYYCFRADTLLAAYNDADSRLIEAATRYAKTSDPADYALAPRKVHEIEVIDSAKYPLALVPAHFTWSDIGNWQALHRALSDLSGVSMVGADSQHHIDVDSSNCLVLASGERIVATLGLDNIVVVSTDDVVLVLNKDQAEQLPELLDVLRRNDMTEYL